MTGKTADVGALYLENIRACFAGQKAFAEKAFAQLSDAGFHVRVGDNTNSIYTIVKHISGNFKSRWTDFLTSDGEKPSRGRDNEFVDDAQSRAQILEEWEEGWKCLLTMLDSLPPADLVRTVTIRQEPMTVLVAINRAWGHLNQHIGQIMLLARHIKGPSWQWLTIAPGESEKFRPRPSPR